MINIMLEANDKKMYENINKTMVDLQETLEHLNRNPNHFMAPLGKTEKQIEKEKRVTPSAVKGKSEGGR